jgi:hypothetical protein
VTFYDPGSAGPDAWKAHDLVAIRYYFPQGAADIKAANPDVILLAANDDLEGSSIAESTGKELPEGWYIHDDEGNRLPFWRGYISNLTEVAISSDYLYGPQRFNQFLPQYLDEHTDWSLFDGTLFDTWYSSLQWYVPDMDRIDLDGDGIADGAELVESRWRQGKRALVSNLRAYTEKPILAHEAGEAFLNGNAFEFWTQETIASRSWNMGQALRLLEEAVPPQLNYANSEAPGSGPVFRADFTSAQIVGAFFGHDEGTFAHRWTYLHDEYLADLGYPTSDPSQLEGGLWIRYFDGGVIISNLSGEEKSLASADLVGGPYYRFRGNQAPDFNDGTLFSEVHFAPLDGILLLKEPKTLITPIIIDNVAHNMTTIGQEPVRYSQGWTQARYGPSGYALGYGWDEFASPFAQTSEPGTATYSPIISVPGDYEIFEWHPDLQADGQGEPCNALTVEIHHAEGTTVRTFDQSVGSGQWNSLGIFPLEQDNPTSVVLHAPGGCVASSDAVKFKWHGDDESPTFADVPPSHPYSHEIELLYAEGYTAGCATDPLRFCPDATMTRAESAVFLERGIHGAEAHPPLPAASPFADVELQDWFVEWATALWEEGYTAGCGIDPLIYCPLRGHTRAEGAVFFLRMLHGVEYQPPPPAGLFEDVPADAWYAEWAEAAYGAGLIEPCGTNPLTYCPNDPLTRAVAAHMMARAMGWTGN